MKRRQVLQLVLIALLLAAAFPLLGARDAAVFLRWYAAVFLIGVATFPLAAILFRSFTDRGWLFSKVLGILLGGFFVWLFSSVGILAFTSRRALVITLICGGLIWSIFMFRAEKGQRPDRDLVLREEILFLAVFLVWTYVAGFRPEAHGTEKFMDYGFVAAMMRSTDLPARDIWFGTNVINYYYGGQYYAAYLTKITWTSVKQTYNLMRMLVAAFAVTLPFSLVRQMLYDRLNKVAKFARALANIGGAIAALAVSFAGNMHYVFYGLLGKVFRLPGYEEYWFPSSTRYIGHNPLTSNDQCIHEFPSYSFVLGDLHAHVVNTMFVLLVLGLLYAWFRHVRLEEEEAPRGGLLPILAEPRLLLAGAVIGLFRWTNYWDFVIYLTVLLLVIILIAIYRYPGEPLYILTSALLHAAEAILIGMLVALPFTLRFDNMVSSVGIVRTHTAPYQLAILWGLPAVLVLVFFVFTAVSSVRRGRKLKKKHRGVLGLIRNSRAPDLYTLLLGVCALGLVLIPELIYVRDIYESNYARSNTMFKLTYQAFIMFAIAMGYILVRLLAAARGLVPRILCFVLLGLFGLTCPYGAYAIKCWYGNIFDRSRYQGLTADAFLEELYPEDAAAIRYLDENVSGQALVLEAEGDSYSDYGRVSAMTGHVTLQGWYVHEWLWRGDPETLTSRAADIRTIYTSDDPEDVRALLRKYRVEYIFVGEKERERYGEINDEVLLSFGSFFYGDTDGTYIVRL